MEEMAYKRAVPSQFQGIHISLSEESKSGLKQSFTSIQRYKLGDGMILNSLNSFHWANSTPTGKYCWLVSYNT